MKLRSEQVALMDRVSSDRFVQRVAQTLRSGQPSLSSDLTDKELLDAIRSSIAVAREYGITSERHAFEFTVITMMLGGGFQTTDEYQWAEGILTDNTMTPGEKILEIQTRLRRMCVGDAGDAMDERGADI